MASKLYERGLEMRKKVLGAAHVEQTLANTDAFSQPLQEMVNEYCWGAVWSRPGLSPRIRSMITVAMLTALNRPAELKLHIAAALGNGIACYELAVWYRRQGQPVPAAQYEARSRELGYTPPPTLDHYRK